MVASLHMLESRAAGSTVEEVGSHEKLEGDLGLDGELRDLGGAVGVAHLVREVHAHLLQHVGPAHNRQNVNLI